MSGAGTPGPPARTATRRFWTRGLTVEVAILLLLPAVPGVVFGWWGLNPPAGEQFTPVGTDAHLLLNNFPDSRLTVEIDYQNGWAPAPSAVAILLDRINETCLKSSVTVEEFPIATQLTAYSEADLVGLESHVRHAWPTFGTMSLDYLYLGGSYAPSNTILGLAFRGSSIAVFAGTIAANAPAGSAAGVTATVFVHEMGHELGLVGLVGFAPNEDPNHPGHSNDPNDVMYWQVETTGALLGLLGGASTPNQFDAGDLSDLSTVRATPIVLELLPWIVLGVSVAGLAAALIVRWRAFRPGRPS